MRYGSLSDRHLTAIVVAACLLLTSTALAEDTISIGTIGAAPDDSAVVVPISARTADVLTGLSMDVVFDRTLCDHIQAIEVRKAGRTSIEAEEGGVRCPQEGRISVVFFDPEGESAVPAGRGPIAELRFDVDSDTPLENFPLALLIRHARNGPLSTEATPVNGALTVAPACAGDCDGDLSVELSELVLGVNVALGQSSVAFCGRIDGDRSGQVTVDELVAGVDSRMQNCPKQ